MAFDYTVPEPANTVREAEPQPIALYRLLASDLRVVIFT